MQGMLIRELRGWSRSGFDEGDVHQGIQVRLGINAGFVDSGRM